MPSDVTFNSGKFILVVDNDLIMDNDVMISNYDSWAVMYRKVFLLSR